MSRKKTKLTVDERVERLGQLLAIVANASNDANDLLESLHNELGESPDVLDGDGVRRDDWSKAESWMAYWKSMVDGTKCGSCLEGSVLKKYWDERTGEYLEHRATRTAALAKLTEEDKIALGICVEMK